VTWAYIGPFVYVRLYWKSEPSTFTDPVIGRPSTMMSPRGTAYWLIRTRLFSLSVARSLAWTYCSQFARISSASIRTPQKMAMRLSGLFTRHHVRRPPNGPAAVLIGGWSE
jgi:hypothetical protein